MSTENPPTAPSAAPSKGGEETVTLSRRTLTFMLTAALGVPLGAVPAGAIGWAQGNSVEAYQLGELSKQVGELSDKVELLKESLTIAGHDRWTRSEHKVFETSVESRLKDLEQKVLLLEHDRTPRP